MSSESDAQTRAPRRTVRALAAASALLLLLLLPAGAFARGARADAPSDTWFYHCTEDLRVQCQPGSEKLAHAILPAIDPAQETVEERQHLRFIKPVVIRTYASRKSFALYSGAPSLYDGAVSRGVLHLSPRLLSAPERIPGIVTHELSHLNLTLALGTSAWGKLPVWFHEGLATWVSSRDGVQTVGASREEAIDSIMAGRSLKPGDQGSLTSGRGAVYYKLSNAVFYRQAEMFVGYLHDTNPDAFRQLLLFIEQGHGFSQALDASYGERIDVLWRRFVAQLRSSYNDPIGVLWRRLMVRLRS
jgi:hypothetical protein